MHTWIKQNAFPWNKMPTKKWRNNGIIIIKSPSGSHQVIIRNSNGCLNFLLLLLSKTFITFYLNIWMGHTHTYIHTYISPQNTSLDKPNRDYHNQEIRTSELTLSYQDKLKLNTISQDTMITLILVPNTVNWVQSNRVQTKW